MTERHQGKTIRANSEIQSIMELIWDGEDAKLNGERLEAKDSQAAHKEY